MAWTIQANFTPRHTMRSCLKADTATLIWADGHLQLQNMLTLKSPTVKNHKKMQ
jgi:hypothetical protein